jgi:GNAT superfamily N-acetyltransferase
MKITKTVKDDQLDVTAAIDDSIVGYANAQIAKNTLTLLVIHVRRECRRTGIGKQILDFTLAEARIREVSQVIGERISSRACWELLVRTLGEPVSATGTPIAQIPEQPMSDIFAPSLGLLRIDGVEEITGIWNLNPSP